MNISLLVEMNEPEIDAEFLHYVVSNIARIEYMNMWAMSFKEFKPIEERLEHLLVELTEYEKRVNYEFPEFRTYEEQIKKQLSRVDRMRFKAGYRRQS